MDPDKYDLFSRIAHGNVTGPPQTHNPIGLPLTSGRFQENGLLVTINEAAAIVVLATMAGVFLIDLEPETRQHLWDEAGRLINSTGGITLTSLPEVLAEQRRRLKAFGASANGESDAN